MGISLPKGANRVILVSFDQSASFDFIVWLRSWEYSSTHTKHISSSSIPWLSWFFLMFQARSWGWGGGVGGSRMSEDTPPLVRQKRSKKGPIFHACIGLSSTIHKKAPPPPFLFKNPGYGPVFWVFSFLLFLGCLLPSANLFGYGFCFFSCLLLLRHVFSGVSVKIAAVPLGCTTVTTCPCKIGTTNPRPILPDKTCLF